MNLKNLTLEENKKVVNVLPYASVDPRGGLIVVDFKESQIRLYDKQGRLKNYFGQRGRGPGELIYPTAATRLTNGDLIVSEWQNGEVNRYTSSGDSLLKTYVVPSLRITDLYSLSNEKILLVGYNYEDPNCRLLYIYNLEKEKLEKSFFKIPEKLGSFKGIMYSIKNLSNADLYHGKIIANFAVNSNFYVFTPHGKKLKEIHVNFKDFRHITKPKGNLSKKMLTKFSKIVKVKWYNDETFIVQFNDIKNINKMKVQPTLAFINTDGKVLFETTTTSSILAVNPINENIYFRKSYNIPANKWKIGQIKK